MKLMIQPDDGIDPILEALRHAKKSIQILIFRFDRTQIEKELLAAVQRGVSVHALIAFTNRGEEKNLRKLESRLLERGVTVARTADDLVRYHGKMFLVDHKKLYLMAFNFTFLDINMSRSFAVMIEDEKIVDEAIKLFEADSKRQPYHAGSDHFVVSPINARERLMAFIEGAKKQLLIYEMKLSDKDFVQLLNQKIADGVEVRILGKASAKGSLPSRTMASRLHARAILRDGESAFLGSQSLRRLEMEARREIGVIFHDEKTVRKMTGIFEKDWHQSLPVPAVNSLGAALDLPAKKVARSVAKKIDIGPIVEQMLEKMHANSDAPFEAGEVSQAVHEAFRDEVHDAVALAMKELVASSSSALADPENKGKPAA